MFDAVALALDRLQAGRHPKKALIVVTDRDDNSSELTFKELIELAEEQDALIYVMGRKLKVVVVHRGQQERKLVARTRSRYFVPGR